MWNILLLPTSTLNVNSMWNLKRSTDLALNSSLQKWILSYTRSLFRLAGFALVVHPVRWKVTYGCCVASSAIVLVTARGSAGTKWLVLFVRDLTIPKPVLSMEWSVPTAVGWMRRGGSENRIRLTQAIVLTATAVRNIFECDISSRTNMILVSDLCIFDTQCLFCELF